MSSMDQGSSAPAGGVGPAEMLVALARGIAPVKIQAGVPLMRQGEPSKTAFVIIQGTVRVVADTPYGAVPLATFSAPRLIGEIGALSGMPRTASIIAVTPLTVHVVPRSRLIEVGLENPQFLISVIGQLGTQLEGMNRSLSMYSNALEALQQRAFDPRILDDLANPSPEMAEFSAAFRKFAEEIVGKRRQQDEVASAAIIQQSYLPKHAILARAADRLELHAHIRPARNMGGDFYDFFFLDDDHLAVLVGDVCGKGIPASLFMAVVMTVLRMSAREEASAEATIARANALLCKDNATTMFATAFYAVLDLRDGTLEYCNCGHNGPLVIADDGTIQTLMATGLPLGLDADISAGARRVSLKPSDLLVIFTDGVTEAANLANEEFSDERLEETVRQARSLRAEEVVNSIFRDVDAFVRTAEQSDDITSLVLRRRTPPAG